MTFSGHIFTVSGFEHNIVSRIPKSFGNVVMWGHFDTKTKPLMQPYATKQFYLKQPHATI